jgi:parallel beta-helix repeat protein
VLRRRSGLLKICLLLAVLFLYLSINLSTVQISLSDSLVSTNRSISQSYTVHDPIVITDDDELASVANNGTGTANDPYIIADWNITGSNTHGISITGTTKHFRIENCWIVNSIYWGSRGIYVENVAPGTTTIAKNTCNNNNRDGIALIDSASSTVANNTCNNNNDDGIALIDSASSNLTGNSCINNSNYGIYIDNSGSTTATKNTFFNDGLYFVASSKDQLISCTVENNMVNKLPLGYFENRTDSTITGVYGQLILVNCNNTMVKNKNFSNTSLGIALYYCDENQLVNNTCNNNYRGIYLWDSASSTVTNNTCDNNYRGISLWDSASSTVANNTCNNNGEGVLLYHCDNSAIANNTCNSNHWDGIFLWESDSSTISSNICNNNSLSGIYLSNSDYNSIVWNRLSGNGDYGIYLDLNSDNNTIHHNSFVANTQHESQASDDGMNNQWYDETLLEGNSWSDYSGTDSYLIAGSAGASDPYPFTNSSPSPAFMNGVFSRIGFFLLVFGLLFLFLFVNRRTKSD